jgi:hypothetical protein
MSCWYIAISKNFDTIGNMLTGPQYKNWNLEGNLSFTEISDDFVEKQINKINVNKATGFDGVLYQWK